MLNFKIFIVIKLTVPPGGVVSNSFSTVSCKRRATPRRRRLDVWGGNGPAAHISWRFFSWYCGRPLKKAAEVAAESQIVTPLTLTPDQTQIPGQISCSPDTPTWTPHPIHRLRFRIVTHTYIHCCVPFTPDTSRGHELLPSLIM
jgi:hypothetical protein